MCKKACYLIAFVLSIVFYSCGDSERRISGNYFLLSMDGNKYQTSLSQRDEKDGDSFDGIIDYMVYAVGFDSRYIIAKQHPWGPGAGPNFKITYYYIVDMTETPGAFHGDPKVYGPYSESEFCKKRTMLGIADAVKFSINVD